MRLHRPLLQRWQPRPSLAAAVVQKLDRLRRPLPQRWHPQRLKPRRLQPWRLRHHSWSRHQHQSRQRESDVGQTRLRPPCRVAAWRVQLWRGRDQKLRWYPCRFALLRAAMGEVRLWHRRPSQTARLTRTSSSEPSSQMFRLVWVISPTACDAQRRETRAASTPTSR